jgi:hypothetical protein
VLVTIVLACNCPDNIPIPCCFLVLLCLQAGNEINLSFSGAVQHGLIVTPFEVVVTKSQGCKIFYPFGGKQPPQGPAAGLKPPSI